uniref:Neur_chan_memb domain-containing protein n=1 Tax=Rhabditophanes sp. KR3021 TaxID=114890 RepID=A0AC35U0M3_9BILA
MYIRNDGTISYGTRVTLNVACNLDLKNYPLDAHVLSEMNATWFSVQPISFNPEIGLPEFKITGMNSELCNGTFRYTLTDESYRIGDFSCLLGVIELDRAIGYHLVQSYIPSSLIVLISFVSFYIDRRAIPARVSLSFTALLTLSTQGNGMRFQVPAVAYAKAIDLFYGVSLNLIIIKSC